MPGLVSPRLCGRSRIFRSKRRICLRGSGIRSSCFRSAPADRALHDELFIRNASQPNHADLDCRATETRLVSLEDCRHTKSKRRLFSAALTAREGNVMQTKLLKGLSLAGWCWLVLTLLPSSANGQSSCQSCPSCQSGYCRKQQCQDCCLAAGLKWLIYDDYYICPPDYGWAVPTKVPVVRKGVSYYRYWPEQWYGTGGSQAGMYQQYAMIANPTDTTQLGYTYQQVPYWQPQSGRVPPPPVPSQWHVRQPHRGYNGRWHSCYTPIHSNIPAGYTGASGACPCQGAAYYPSMMAMPTQAPSGLVPVPENNLRKGDPMPMPPEPEEKLPNQSDKDVKSAKRPQVGRALVTLQSRR